MIQIGVAIILASNVAIKFKPLQIFINILPALMYLALFYDTLFDRGYAPEYYVKLANVPTLLMSIIGMINFLLFSKVDYFSKQRLKRIHINK